MVINTVTGGKATSLHLAVVSANFCVDIQYRMLEWGPEAMKVCQLTSDMIEAIMH